MMKVDEQMLISEGNKILRKLLSQKKPDRTAYSPSPISDLPDGINVNPSNIGEDSVDPDLFAPHTGDSEIQKPKLYYQEEAFVRLLVLYGCKELEPGISVCDYVLGEINELEFKDPIFFHLLTLFRENHSRGNILPTEYFLRHHESDIRELAMGWATDKYELSELWQEKFEIFVPFETDVLDKTAFINILRLKKAYYDEKMKEFQLQLANTQSAEEQMSIMKEYLEYKKVSMKAASELGSVIG